MYSIIAETTYRVFGKPVSGSESILWLMAVFGLWLCFRMLSDHFDRARITRYVRESGGAVKSIAWDPLGPGWFGARGVRIYQVCYRTRQGKTVTANCKTSLFSGVYWTGGPVAASESSSKAVSCLSCGSVIPEDAEKCSKCGWSYGQEEKAVGYQMQTVNSPAKHEHADSNTEWPFTDADYVLAFSTARVVNEGYPILRVSHDHNGDWQILCDTTLDLKDACLVCLGCAFHRDKTIGELADLPRGWTAWRDFIGGPWQREEKSQEQEAD